MPGSCIKVSKRNMIIPYVEENLDRGGFDMDKLIPHACPCCGQPTRTHETEKETDLDPMLFGQERKLFGLRSCPFLLFWSVRLVVNNLFKNVN